jgi:hypothetical protein
MRLYAVACDVVARPVYLCAARSPHVVDLRLFERGLHNDPRSLRDRLQDAIDEAPPLAEAIVLGYGLCGGATAGLVARDRPVVLPRAHDCITLFLGARERYAEEHARVSTYWYVADQLERTGGSIAGVGGLAIGSDTDAQVEATRAEYVERYGEDNADYLMEVLGGWRAHYGRAAFVSMGVADEGPAEDAARAEAERRGWAFERIEGSLVLLRRLLDGDWGDEMLVLQPGEQLAMSWVDGVVRAVPAAR